jgi:hypothetical protein
VGHSAGMPKTLLGRRVVAAWRRLLHDEEGIALVLVIVSMLVLTLALTTVMFMTAAGARDAHRSNAGQKASALAESGINNALAVLNANYPGVTIYPGDSTLLPTRTTTYPTGSVTWSGTLVNVPTNPDGWKWQWELTALGSVQNPTGPGAGDVVRRATAVVPVVIPDSTSVPPGTTATDWIYGLNDVTFGQSVVVAAPVYAGHDIILENTSTISETIPASLTKPARPNRIAAGHNLSLVNPQNQVGHVNGSADPANDLAEIHVANLCSSKDNPTPHACAWGATDKIWGLDPVGDNFIPPGYITTPTLTCCSPMAWAAPSDGASHPAPITIPPTPSYMGFWYLNAGLGPNTRCATWSGTPPRFDTVSGTPDNTINQSAYLPGSPFDLTGASYSCTSADGQTKLAWDGTTLTIKGTVFIDGSARSTSTNAKYVGKGTIVLSGLYTMDNNTTLCVNLSGGTCDTSAPWDADTTALAIVADGIDPSTGDSVQIKKGNYQGLLLGNGNIDASVSGTLVVGPMVSVYGSVDAGQSGTLQFPPITFAGSGTDGLTGPLPLPRLLPPIQFGGG